jgi:hypothetical protein
MPSENNVDIYYVLDTTGDSIRSIKNVGKGVSIGTRGASIPDITDSMMQANHRALIRGRSTATDTSFCCSWKKTQEIMPENNGSPETQFCHT